MTMQQTITAYDSTLRDGAQAQGVSFTVEDKLKIVQRLDELGIGYIEAGNPGSNPKDLMFFERVRALKLKHAKIIAFGSTRKPSIHAAIDANLQSLLLANTEAVAIFGKSWDYQVTDILRTGLDENLSMIADSIAFLKAHNKEIVFDAEHFFDGYKANPQYALKTLQAAAAAGANILCLCDTNGGTFTDEIFTITQIVVNHFDIAVGIHCHNDCEMAVANSIAAVKAGARQVQGTINGIGERCGNANLCAIIPNVQLKLGLSCIPAENMPHLAATARFVSEVANMAFNDKAAYVGYDAFSHKGGMHIDAVSKNPISYEHIDPALVGNARHILVSEVAGRSALLAKINLVDASLTKDSIETKRILAHLKSLENEGYQFENAEHSFDLLIVKLLGQFKPFFKLDGYSVNITDSGLKDSKLNDNNNAQATVKITVNGQNETLTAQGDGPVNALDIALRQALEHFYPQLSDVKLIDYKVRVLDSNQATASKVRVLIESADKHSSWTTIGVSTDIIDASWRAMCDSIEYKLLRDSQQALALVA